MAAEGAARTSQVFDEVYFAIIPSDDLSPAEADKVPLRLSYYYIPTNDHDTSYHKT